jgi:hypothetical protein
MASVGVFLAWTKPRSTPGGVRCLLASAFDAGLLGKGLVRPRWSLGALGLDDADASALCGWYEQLHEDHVRRLLGSFAPADIPLPSAYGGLTLSNEAALGVLLLALAAVVTRQKGDVKEVWRCLISLPCRPEVRALLFTPGGQPRTDTKSAIREAALRLRLRTPGEERDLHWYYRTVLLQIGLTASAATRLPGWVANRTHAPAAVQTLLDPDPDSGLYDNRFAKMWAAFHAVLKGGDRGRALVEALACRWMPNELLEQYLDQLCAAAGKHAADSDDVEGPIGTPYFEVSPRLRLLILPLAFRDESAPDVVDLFLEGRRRARFIRQSDGSLCPSSSDPIELVATGQTEIELRCRDGSLLEARSVSAWNDDELVCVGTKDPSLRVVLLDDVARPEVQPPTVPVVRFGDRWAVVVTSTGCTIRVGGEAIWTDLRDERLPIEVGITLEAPFVAGSPGKLLVMAPPPLRIHAVRIEGCELILAPCDGRWMATGVIDPAPLGPTARVQVVVDGPGGRRSLNRRIALEAGAWVHDGTDWRRIGMTAEIEVARITTRAVRLGLPGFASNDGAILAGHYKAGLAAGRPAPLPQPLGYGEALRAIDARHGAQRDECAQVQLCGAVVRRQLAAGFVSKDSTEYLELVREVEIDPSVHWLFVWHEGGSVERLVPYAQGDLVSVPPRARAVALCSGTCTQAVAWREAWSAGLDDQSMVHTALLATRALRLPFLASPHRERMLTVASRHPSLVARTWLARDPLHESPSNVFTNLDLDETESWCAAVRELLEPAWTSALADRKFAEAIFDELRRARNTYDCGADYHLAARLLRGLGGQSVVTLLNALPFPRNPEERNRLHRKLGADCIDDSRAVGPDGKVAIGRARQADRELTRELCLSLGVSMERLGAVLLQQATAPSFLCANHNEAFRRAMVRSVLLTTFPFDPTA